MAIGHRLGYRGNSEEVRARPHSTIAANTTNDLLTVNFSAFAEGYGFDTFSFAADATGGWKGTYYLDGNTRVDFVSIERFNITGTDYGDRIITGDGVDTINGGGGNDLIYSGLGKDTLDGGAGIDGISRNLIDSAVAININLRDSTVTAGYGTIANFEFFKDFIGTTKADVFISSLQRGDDVVNAGDGNDRGEFVRGYDSFTGGAGTDTVRADFSWSDTGSGITTSIAAESSGLGFNGTFYLDGPNRLNFGTTENFEVIGTKYRDLIYTGSGNDLVMGGAGNDDIRTGAGIDVLDGGDGIDGVGRDFSLLATAVSVNLGAGTLTGIAGQIVNFEYFASISGGGGNDVFVSTNALANDYIIGGGANDTATFFNGHDFFGGTLGTDRLIVDYSAAANGASAAGQGISTSLNVDTDGGYYGYFYVNNDLWADFDSVEAFTVTGTIFADSIITGDGDDTISAGDGYDVVRSGAGVDVLDGGAGLDGVGRNFGSSSLNVAINLLTNTVSGISGSITNFEYFSQLVTGLGADQLVSTRFTLNDSVNTGDGNDTFTTYAGYDTYAAGLGTNDRLVIDWSLQQYGSGINNISQVADPNGGWQGYFIINGTPTRIDYSSVEAFTITATAYNDVIQTRGGDDILNGLAGNDTLNAGAGTDTIDGGDGIDGFAKDFTASTRNIVVDLTANTITNVDTTIANVEYLLDVRTGSGADRFITLGLKANDTAWGGGGNDIAYFFSGYDTFQGGSGADRLVVDYSALDTDQGIQTSVQVDNSNGGFLGYYYVEADNRSDFSSVESVDLTGTKNNDSITGTGGADTLRGGDGRDTINGGNGNDVIDGGTAGDAINGGVGNDTITGGKGSDTLTGETGADKFVFAPGDVGSGTIYIDRITDFNRTTDSDVIDVSRIDADSGTAGNQAFTFIGNTAFSGAAGELRLIVIGGLTYVQGNTDADLDAEFAIRVDGETPIATDFVL